MPPSTPTVFIVDDDASFLAAVSRLLRATGHPVKAFSSASEFLQNLPAAGPGCVVADVQMPGLSGLDLQAALTKTNNPLPVLFLTGHGDIPTSVRAMRQGAEDFLTKRAPKEELIEAVKRALARDARERAERTRVQGLRARFEALTGRDREVLEHVLRGQLNKEIAGDLRIDERSVKRHRTRIMAKLQVKSVAGLAHLVHEAGLASLMGVSNQ
jgi:FixJ family two-component response regulator